MRNKIGIHRYSQTGISLIELMVGLTIGLIITAAAFTILFSNQKLIVDKEVMDRSQENFRFAATTITRLIRQANELGIPTNNNELIVTFDRTQRDCLGQVNNSWINTFKVNNNHELLCVLNNDETKSYVLAKDITEIKFAYGIQNGVSANSLVYQPRFSGQSNTENAAVVNAWNTVTSVLTQLSVSEGRGQQPTIDFIATSHLLALTKLASSGGISHASTSSGGGNSSSGGSSSGNSNGGNTEGGNSDGNDNSGGNTNDPTSSDGVDCAATDLSFIKINSMSWPNQISYTMDGIGKGGIVTVVVNGTISSNWRIARDGGNTQPLGSSQSFQLPNGNNKSMTLTLSCGSVPSRQIIVGS